MPKPLNILDGESVEEFDALSATFHADLQPTTETERFLVDMMVQHEWLMRRAVRMQHALLSSVSNEAEVDPKKLGVVVRYYRTHERAAAEARRQLDSMRKQKLKEEKANVAMATRETAHQRRQQRQWEQILKKMPPLTNWVN